MKFTDHIDSWSFVVIALTFVLFAAALATTGFTHDLLLETGVFLVSVKLILMAYRSSVANAAIEKKLDAIHQALEGQNGRKPSGRRVKDS